MNKKKGFTLVELVVVIAIIAILAAVIIPTFVHLIRKANVSKDSQLIRNLNTALATSRAENNRKHANMTEALIAADEFGYEVGKINASATNAEILWDSKNDVFCYFDGNAIKYLNDSDRKEQPDDVDYWVIRNVTAATRGEAKNEISARYSTYLAGYKGAASIEINKGLDVGETTAISSISYKNYSSGQTVAVRTNGGTLTVDAPNDTVKHFNSVELVDIKQVASTSYHEYGQAGLAKIANGRLVITEKAVLNGIHAVATGTGGEAYFNGIAIGVVGGAKVPQITRDKVAIDEAEAEGRYSQFVLEVQTLKSADDQAKESDKNYLWINLTIDGSGKTEETVASDTKVTEATKKINSGDGVQAAASTKPSAAAAKIAQNTETAVYVRTVAELQSALDAEKKYIIFADDIAAAQAVTVDCDTTIDGAGHTLTTSNYVDSDARSINVGFNNPGVTANIRNLTVAGPTGAYSRGLNIANSSVTLNVYNCTVSAGHYAINVPSSGDHLKMNITDSTVSGWAALNVWAFYNEITVTNSTLVGTNDKSEGSSNSFSTICFESNTTFSDDEHSYNNKITVKGSTIKAIETNSNSQAIVGFNGGTIGAISCVFVTENCVFESTNGKACYDGGSGNSWINDGNEMLVRVSADLSEVTIESDGHTASGTVKFTIDGTVVSYDLADAKKSTWTSNSITGTDYVFEYGKGTLVYTLDLDISGYYGAGYAIYVDTSFGS